MRKSGLFIVFAAAIFAGCADKETGNATTREYAGSSGNKNIYVGVGLNDFSAAVTHSGKPENIIDDDDATNFCINGDRSGIVSIYIKYTDSENHSCSGIKLSAAAETFGEVTVKIQDGGFKLLFDKSYSGADTDGDVSLKEEIDVSDANVNPLRVNIVFDAPFQLKICGVSFTEV